MSVFIAILNRAALPWLEAIWRASWQGGLALALVWGFVQLRPRLSPRVQCWLWRLAYLKFLTAFFWATPLTLAILPPVSSPPSAFQPAAAPPATIAPATSTSALSMQGTPSTAVVAAVTPASITLTPVVGLAALWLGMVVWQTGRALAQWGTARRIYRACRPIQTPELLSVCTQFSQRLGLHRTPRLLTWDEAGTPILLGAWKPSIVLPETMLTSSDLTDPQLMLAHELAHLRRRDLFWAWLPLLARILFGFHPLVWLAQRELTTAQEMDCDAVALEITHAPIAEYGDLLLRIATHRGSKMRSELTIIGMAASYHTLKRRLFAMKTIAPLSPARLALAGSALLALGLAGIVPWRVAAQNRADSTTVLLNIQTDGKSPAQDDAHATPGRNETSMSFANPLKAKAGKYTLWLEKVALVNIVNGAEAREIISKNVHFKPNMGFYLKVIGQGSDMNLLAGLSPQAAAVDAKGAHAEPSPATEPERLNSSAQGSTGALYLLLPDAGVKTLRSLEGTLVVYDGDQKRLELPVGDLKPGYQKQFDTTTVKIDAYHPIESLIEADLTVTTPYPPVDPAVARDPKLLAEISGQNARSLRVELGYGEGHVYTPMTMSSTAVNTGDLRGQGNRPLPVGEAPAMRQTMHVTFMVPSGSPPPKTLAVIVASRGAKTERIPFKFTDVPLPASR